MPGDGSLTTRQRLLQESAEELAPHKSLESLVETARWVVASISVAATVLSALGTLGAVELADVDVGWALPTVLLAAVSVALAVWAALPVKADVKPGNLNSVEAFFDRQLRCRGCLLRCSSAAFALAVIAAPLPLVIEATEGESPKAKVAVSITSSSAVINAAFTELPEGATVDLRARAGGRVVARQLAIEQNGALDVELKPELPKAARHLTARLRVTDGKDVILRRTVHASVQ